jgi:tRNA (mo5U34)-methyltransferase
MRTRLTEEGFLQVNTTWSPERFKALEAEIVERRSTNYYQHIIMCDKEGKGIETSGHHQTTKILPLLDGVGFPKSFKGKHVLDIGCNAGFYSMAAKLRGAKRVLGIDHQQEYVDQALMVRSIMELSEQDIEFCLSDENTLASLGETFDYVINTGVMYHLENPMDFLRKVSAIATGTMFMESEMLIDEAHTEHAWFAEDTYGDDPSNWWICGPRCLERMARAAGFRTAEFQGFIWKPEPGTTTSEGYPRQGRGVVICQK